MASTRHQNTTKMIRVENSFGPGAGDQQFDFTLFFEQSILAVGPSTLLLLVVPIRVWQLLQQRRKVVQSHWTSVKISAYIVFGALQVALLTQWALLDASTAVNRVSVAASVLGILDSVALGALSYVEHNRSVRPSTVISVYLFVSIALDAVQCRTLWLLGTTEVVAAVFTAMLAMKLFLFALEVHGKRAILLQAWRLLGPESTSGIISRGFFWWLNGLLTRGFSGGLSLGSLWDVDDELRSHHLLQRMRYQWGRRRDTGGKYSLLLTVVNCNKIALARCVFPRLCLTGFKFAQPFLIKRVVSYIQSSQTESKSTGYGLIAATGLVYTGTALSMGFYQHKVFRCLTLTRGLLTSAILADTSKLNTFSEAGSGALTYITSDVDRICSALESLHEIWANVIELGLATWLLELQLGVGCLGPMVAVIICAIATSQVSRFTAPAIKAWNGAIQERVSITSRILGSIKEIKMLGLTEQWIESIQTLRIKELKFSQKSRTLMMCMNVLGNTPAKVAPVATFGIAIASSKYGLDERLSTSTAFASLTIMSLIVGPLALLMYAVPDVISSVACFERIQSFINEANYTGHDGSTVHASGHQNSAQRRDGIELATSSTGREDANVITARHANFTIKKGVSPILKDINLTIKLGSLTVVTGKTGSGKTMLLRSLLGELHTDGFLQTSGTGAAFCAQTAWLVNSTIRRNILGQTAMEEEWYREVVHACALDADFAHFAAGDLVLIGSKGITLSGGQKQRVALARAIYSRKPVMLVDDVLSGLDWATRNGIWSRVFGPAGILRRHRTTVLMATHTLTFIEDADSIVVLAEDGRIACQGSFDSLHKASFLTTLLSSQQQQNVHRVENSEIDNVSGPDDKLAKTQEKEAEEEDTTALGGSGDSSLYLYYLESIGWRYGVPLSVILVAHAIMGVLSDIWLRIWTDANMDDTNVNTGKYFGIYALIAVLALAAIALDTWFMFVRVIPKSAQQLHFVLLQTAMRAPLSFFATTDVGDLTNRFSKDMSLVDRDLPSSFWQCVGALLSALVQTALVLQGARYFGTIVPVALVFLYILQKFYLHTSRQLRSLELQASAPLHTHLLETVDGLSTIRAFGWQSATTEAALKLLDRAQKPYYLLFCIQRWLTLVLDLFISVIGVLLVTFGVVAPSTTNTGAMALAMVNMIGLNQVITHVITTWTTLETSLGAISRLKTFKRDTLQEEHPKHLQETPAKWPTLGSVRFRNVSASYSAGTSIKPILDGVSLEIQAGEKIALCGRTGSGKSSLLLTLFRLLDISSGSITIDGVDINHIRQDTLRQHIISVPQEATLFPGSLRSNLGGSKFCGSITLQEPNEEQMIAALEKVQLWSTVSRHGGLDADVADLALSHGQKQLLCLARAMLRKNTSAILILDEVMSAVDKHTEAVMLKIVETEFVTHTVLSVVHRLDTILKFDKIIMLEGGMIVETGKPANLLQKSAGRFRALFDGDDED